MSDLQFEKMLSLHNQAFQDAEEFSDWMPPDREDYICTGIKCSSGTSTKDPDNPMGWWKPIVRIEEPSNPELNGKEFALGFFSTKALGIMKGQARAINNGEAVADLVEASDVLKNRLIGKVFRVNVATTTSAKNGNTYHNAYVREVLASTPVEDQSPEPPQGSESTPAIAEDDIPF